MSRSESRTLGRARSTLLLCIVLPSIFLALAGPSVAATERVSISFTLEGSVPGPGAGSQIYDSYGRNAGCRVSFVLAPECRNDIPNTSVTAIGNTISFVDQAEAGLRCFRVAAADGGDGGSPTSVRATFTHPDGSRTDVGPFQLGAQILVGTTPPEPGLTPGGAVPIPGQCEDGSLGGGGENRPPIASPDAWTVRAGWTADENVLLNDVDPDGDAITAKVLRIDFAAKEYSKMDLDGGFLYTAGPGTSKALKKKITYVAIDSQGARSKPTTAVVKIRPAKHAKNNPTAKGSAASTQPYWSGPWTGWGRLCFGAGLNTRCYTMLSAARAKALNNQTPWTQLSGAAAACLKYGFLPMKNADCAQSLLQKSLFEIWNKTIVRNAARWDRCLMFRVDRNRSVQHPRAGVWGKPEYATLDSLVRPYTGNAKLSGWGTWIKDGLKPLFSSARWRIPLFCQATGVVYSRMNYPTTTAP